ncbi:MFS transporter [Amnibacterium sp. CER49]|uniref:MFS transporter n=1 Tax=Amnibacterium sp. CER49 TaxID=3039161 RepID=UPI0024489420|nr:MFS transporter [Amnibacterium sp. CER49]MDH2442617.1 MFS transporter [Amnibacterium sp. CER49]
MVTPAAHPENPPAPDDRVRRPGSALAIGSIGFFLITLDILIVNLALPRLSADLGGTATGRQWVIDAYTLVFASLLLFGGNLADRTGAKRGIAIGTALFGVASAGCALAPALGLLIAARVLQGAAAAVLLPASMSLIREAYPDPAARARALGIWAVGGAIAGTVGPPLGGLLAAVDWRLVFAINLPPCLLMLLLLVRVHPSPTRPARFDLLGQILAVVTLAALVGSLIEGGALGYGSPVILGGFALAAAGLVAFVLSQRSGSHPMMPLGVFRPAPVRLALALGFAFMVSNFGTAFLVSLYLQQHLGLDPLHAGLLFLLSPAFSIAGNLTSGRATNRWGARVPVIVGMSVLAIGDLAIAAVAPVDSSVLVTGMLALTGFGGAFAMPPTSGIVLAAVPQRLAGTASAVFNTFRQIGGAVAIAVFGALVAAPERFVEGMQASMLTAGALVVVVVIAAARTPLRSGVS